MIQNRHLVSIYVNGVQVELYDQESLNLRINNVLYDPSSISTKTADYSFSFNLPITNKNSKIFNYANNTAKLNKFNKNFNCIVYSDDIEIFKGKLKLSSIDNDNFKCNLVNIKVNKVEDIFGESKMNELRWEVPFVGIDSINSVNNDMSTNYYYPLVSYGVFQKKPKNVYTGFNQYTPKHTLDKYLQLYLESFPPSVKLTDTVKKLFQAKGYDVQGNIFEDDIASNIFISENLKDKQDPLYNIGSKLGKVTASWNWKNINRKSGGGYSYISPLMYNLNYPYEFVWTDIYNFDVVNIWDIWSAKEDYLTSLTHDNDYLFRDNCIVAPADGLYKITMDVNISIANAQSSMNVKQWFFQSTLEEKQNTTIYKGFNSYPVEIQLVRNTNECELIYGQTDLNTVYPHEAPAVRRSRRPIGGQATAPIETKYSQGYMPKNGELLCYDPFVSEKFVVGVTSIGNCPSVIKNGYSWNSTVSVKNNARYNCGGYWGVNKNGRELNWELTEYNQNTLPGSPSNYVNSTSTFEKKGKVTCIVELKKNDLLSLKCVCKNYEMQNNSDIDIYDVSCSGNITFEAFSPNASVVIGSPTLNWNDESKFDTNLNLGNFFNADEKQSDFINNFIKAFNLVYNQDGNTVYLNKQLINFNAPIYPVNIDDRVNTNEAMSLAIDYPSSMQVKFSIDEEEAGFYDSVPSDKINLENWKNYADVGSEKVELLTTDETTDEELSLNTSYCWYTDFKYEQYDRNNDDALIGTMDIKLPIISKDEYMIEGYSYEDSMKVDGKGLKQRWWFRQPVNNNINFKLTNGDIIYCTIPIGYKDDFLLNYNNDENTLLTRYFNISAMSNSNLIEVSCYLSPREYKTIKISGIVKFDDDAYIVNEINGYDPTGNNKTKLTLMKKV